MPPKFSKALLAAGLAAALVGCGGGSSDTTINPSGGGSMNETTALDGTYDTANDLVGKLSADSTPAQFKEAKDARTALLNQLLAAGDDVSSEKRTELNGKLTTLENVIMAAEKARDEKVAAAKKAEDDKKKDDEAKRVAGLLPSAWYKSVKDHDPVNPGTFPPDNVLVGTETNVTGLPEGWKGTNYEYEEGATNEQGKTFMKTVTKMTPEIELTWENLAREAAKTNRSSLINDYLGDSGIQIQALPTGDGQVSATITGKRILAQNTPSASNPNNFPVVPAASNNSGATLFDQKKNPGIATITDFKREHFAAMTASELIDKKITANDGATGNAWTDLSKQRSLTITANSTASIHIKWQNIPGLLTITTTSDAPETIDLRFNNGRLEYALGTFSSGGELTEAENVVVKFQPSDPNDLTKAATQNIHTMPLMVRKENEDTATTELAYWASTMKDNTKVTLKTWAQGMDFDPVTDMPEKLTGSAEYHGLAAGYYAVGTESNGEFTADTVLTANFGTNMVNGTIKGFEAVTGGADLSPWSLTLNSASFIDNKETDDMTDDVFKTFTGRTVSNGGILGHWKGEFLGMANPGTDLESAADMTNDYPEAVVSNFTGHFDNKGHVVGAFGVELHDDNKE